MRNSPNVTKPLDLIADIDDAMIDPRGSGAKRSIASMSFGLQFAILEEIPSMDCRRSWATAKVVAHYLEMMRHLSGGRGGLPAGNLVLAEP